MFSTFLYQPWYVYAESKEREELEKERKKRKKQQSRSCRSKLYPIRYFLDTDPFLQIKRKITFQEVYKRFRVPAVRIGVLGSFNVGKSYITHVLSSLIENKNSKGIGKLCYTFPYDVDKSAVPSIGVKKVTSDDHDSGVVQFVVSCFDHNSPKSDEFNIRFCHELIIRTCEVMVLVCRGLDEVTEEMIRTIESKKNQQLYVIHNLRDIREVSLLEKKFEDSMNASNVRSEEEKTFPLLNKLGWYTTSDFTTVHLCLGHHQECWEYNYLVLEQLKQSIFAAKDISNDPWGQVKSFNVGLRNLL